jgi:hypothetical protein
VSANDGPGTGTEADADADGDTGGEGGSGPGPGRREVAYRLFAAEFDDADLSYSESDEERAPNYVVTPSGARINRLFAVGVLTEVESVNEGVLRGRVVDPTGAFVTYAGQYQPDALAFLERAEPPGFVALTGKARTFQPDDSDRVFTSVRPESIGDVDAETRDRWTVTAAEATLRRIAFCAEALSTGLAGEELRLALLESGAPEALATGIPLAIDHYGTTEAYLEALRRVAVDAIEQVADEREDVRPLDVAPGETGPATLGPLPPLDGASTGGDAVDDGDAGAVETAGPSDDLEPAGATGGSEPADAGTSDSPSGSGSASTSTAGSGSASTSTAGSASRPTSESASSATDAGAEGTAGDAVGTTSASVADEGGSVVNEGGSVADEGGDGLEDFDDGDTGLGADVDDESGGGLGDFDDGIDAASDPAAGGAGSTDPSGDDSTEGGDGDVGDVGDVGVTDEMYELDEAEREEIESEFGTGFETGNEVDAPGEADIDVPDPDDLEPDAPAEEHADEVESGSDPQAEEELEPETESEPEPETEPDTGGIAGSSTGTGAGPESGTGAEPATGSGTGAESATGSADDDVEEPDDVDLEDAAVELMRELDDGDGADREVVVEALGSRHGADPDAAASAIEDALMSGQCYEPSDGILKPI